tara:strand:+ start:4682 stop:5239 length:558 start_codon:yes stop_codon:yes gene_type:complete
MKIHLTYKLEVKKMNNDLEYDIFDIVKLYQEDITKVEYKRKTIDASMNSRNNKLNKFDTGEAVNKEIAKTVINNTLLNIKQHPGGNASHSFSFWYREQNDRWIIHVGNNNSGSQVRNIVIFLAPTKRDDKLVDVMLKIDTNLLRFDQFINEYMKVNVYNATNYLTVIILKLMEYLQDQIPNIISN